MKPRLVKIGDLVADFLPKDDPANRIAKNWTLVGWQTEDGTLVESQVMSIDFAKNSQGIRTVYAIWLPGDQTRYHISHYTQNLDASGVGVVNEYTITNEGSIEKWGTTNAFVNGEDFALTLEGFTLDLTVDGTVASGNILADESLNIKLYYIFQERK